MMDNRIKPALGYTEAMRLLKNALGDAFPVSEEDKVDFEVTYQYEKGTEEYYFLVSFFDYTNCITYSYNFNNRTRRKRKHGIFTRWTEWEPF